MDAQMGRMLDDFLCEIFGEVPIEQAIETDLRIAIASIIHTEQIKRGLTQQQFAEQLGIDQGLLSRYENGKENPSIKSLAKLFGRMDIRVDLITRASVEQQPWRTPMKTVGPTDLTESTEFLVAS